MMRVAAAMMALLVCGVTTAATINVAADGSGDYTTIQAAVDAASGEDVILVAPGTYTGTGDEVVDTHGKAITIKASGTPGETIIDGQDARRGITCTGGGTGESVIEGLTIANGYAVTNGGGIYCDESSPTLTDCIFLNNTANGDGGGAFFGDGTSPVLEGCEVLGNESAFGGGLYFWDNAMPTITGCTVDGNTAVSHGGGIYARNDSSPTIDACIISHNESARGGGVLLAYRCDASISNSRVSDNTSTGKGGGIYCYPDSTPLLANCIISGNTADSGGPIYAQSTSLPVVQDTVVCANTPQLIEGPWLNSGGCCVAELCSDVDADGVPDTCDMTDALCMVPSEYPTIQDALASVVSGGTVLVSPGTWTGVGQAVLDTHGKSATIASTDGPGATILDGQNVRRTVQFVSGEDSNVVLDGFTITNGYAAIGAGILIQGANPTITNCLVVHNVADDGAGIACESGAPMISNCNIHDNEAVEFGGGLYCGSGGYPIVSSCEIATNSAGVTGGGVHVLAGGVVTIGETTICDNLPNQISGPYSDEGGNSISATCEAGCNADVAGNDQVVDGADLDVILSLWNQEVDAIDIDGDGIIGIMDLLMLLEAWGPCP